MANSASFGVGDLAFLPALPLLMVGLLIPSCAVTEIRDSLRSSAEPVSMSCRALANHPLTGERHVALSEAYFGPLAYIPGDDGWRTVYVPVGPGQYGEAPDPSGIHVVVVSHDIHNEAQLMSELGDGRITGLLKWRGVTAPPSLKEDYPTVDWKNCWQLQHNAKPVPAATGVGHLFLGLILLAIGATATQFALQLGVSGIFIVVLTVITPPVGLIVALNALVRLAKPSVLTVSISAGLAMLLLAGGGMWLTATLNAESGWPGLQALLLLWFGSMALGLATYQVGCLSLSPAGVTAADGTTPSAAPSPVVPWPTILGVGMMLAGLIPVGIVLLWTMVAQDALSPVAAVLGLGLGGVLFIGGAACWLLYGNPTEPAR